MTIRESVYFSDELLAVQLVTKFTWLRVCVPAPEHVELADQPLLRLGSTLENEEKTKHDDGLVELCGDHDDIVVVNVVG